jgi:hypothetical protein
LTQRLLGPCAKIDTTDWANNRDLNGFALFFKELVLIVDIRIDTVYETKPLA